MLRPGMTTQVEIVIEELEDVLTVPVTAVVPFGDSYLVAVEKGDGLFEWRQVKLGKTNDIVVEVKEGLKGDERIKKNPMSLLSPEERNRVLEKSAGTNKGRRGAR
jgi:multidrug efflux pump subunit AcrA (membrane-fusion protein)